MPATITTEQVWLEVEKRSFAVLGYVTPRGEARSVGIVYAVRDRQLYVITERDTWKARHIALNPHVSLTVTIPKRIPFLPWLPIPAATISFQGQASLHALEEVPPEIPRALLRGLELGPARREEICVIEIRPAGEFVTLRRWRSTAHDAQARSGPRPGTRVKLAASRESLPGLVFRPATEISKFRTLPRKYGKPIQQDRTRGSQRSILLGKD